MLNILYDKDPESQVWEADINAMLNILYDAKPESQVWLADLAIQHTDTVDVLSTFDKLMMSNSINSHINADTMQRAQIDNTQLINHTLRENNIISAYAREYKVLHNNKINLTSKRNYNYDVKITRAILNGMHIKKLILYICDDESVHISNKKVYTHLRTSIEKLLCADYEYYRKYNATGISHDAQSFAKSLKIVHADTNYGISDGELGSCTNIEELYADNNGRITTCDPFAKSLKLLVARRSCGITDDGLRTCTHIEHLDASHNSEITTCEPFAQSLKILFAYGWDCGITDAGLRLCVNIEKLNANSNNKITTCVPFAKSLKILFIDDSNRSITDNVLLICVNIEIFEASYNKNVTTCTPFARSLRVLYIRNKCGITDAGLRFCINIEELNAHDNPDITTCEPFAKSLRR